MEAVHAGPVLAALGERMGLAGLALDANGACQLLFDGRWLVTLLHLPAQRCLGLHCPVSGPAEGGSIAGPALRDMLRASFHGEGAGGATLCIGPDQRAYLQRWVPLSDAPVERLPLALEDMLAHAQAWTERLARGAPEPHPPPGRDLAWDMRRA